MSENIRRPKIELHPISPQEVPNKVAAEFAERSMLYIANAAPFSPGDFDELLLATHSSGIGSFVSRQDKTYSHGETERIYTTVDAFLSPGGDTIGHAELRFSLTDTSPYFLNKPFIGGLFTKNEYRHTRHNNLLERLCVLAEISECRLQLPLYSDSVMSRPAQMVVRRLARAGLVEEIIEDGFTRYKSTGISNPDRVGYNA